MLLGDVIARLDDENVALETLLSLGDLVLLARVETAAERAEVTAGAFTAHAVRIFSSHASDEDWVGLMGVVGQSQDPGGACLRRMIEFALLPDGTNHACGHHPHAA